nr:hypothetical protein [Enterococcus faecalis]
MPVEEREQIKQQISENLARQHENILQLIQLFTQLQEATGSTALQDSIDKLNELNQIISDLKTVVDGIDVNADRKSTRLNSSHSRASRMPSSA